MKVKTKEVNEELQALASKNKTRELDELLESYKIGALDVKSMTQDEIDLLSYDVKSYDEQYKALYEKIKTGKEIILEWMKAHKKFELEGLASIVKISGKTTLEVLASKMIEYLKKVKKMNLVDSVLKVQITEAKKYLGEDVMGEIGTKSVEKFASVKLEKK